jgi:hypothetical protein
MGFSQLDDGYNALSGFLRSFFEVNDWEHLSYSKR